MYRSTHAMFQTAYNQSLEQLCCTEADITLQGAHLTRFKDWLYLSPNSPFAPEKPIRGGVPVIFPWFGPKQNAPQHGLARTALWEIENVAEDALTLRLELEAWRARMKFGFTDELRLRLEVENIAPIPMPFECAFHTYFAVEDVRGVFIEGLDGKTYLDKTDAMKRKSQAGEVTLNGETDRVYLDSPGPITIRDARRGFRIEGVAGWHSTVVWNPWSEKAAALPDLGAAEWPRFVCVECGAIADDAVTLAPDESYVLDISVGHAER